MQTKSLQMNKKLSDNYEYRVLTATQVGQK